MKPPIKSLLLLLASCLLLSACDDDAGVLKISIDTPTTEASFSTTASELLIGGTVSYGGSMGYAGREVYATNLRTGKRYEADLPVGTGTLRWHVLIPDLQPGDNEIVATVLTANDFKETRITIIRTQYYYGGLYRCSLGELNVNRTILTLTQRRQIMNNPRLQIMALITAFGPMLGAAADQPLAYRNPKRNPHNQTVRNGHVYIVNQGHWKRWILFSVNIQGE